MVYETKEVVQNGETKGKIEDSNGERRTGSSRKKESREWGGGALSRNRGTREKSKSKTEDGVKEEEGEEKMTRRVEAGPPQRTKGGSENETEGNRENKKKV